jgi:hypothetical protein
MLYSGHWFLHSVFRESAERTATLQKNELEF